MFKRLLLLAAVFVAGLDLPGWLLAQNGPCGSAPHCAVITWTPGTGGNPATGFNIKRSTVSGGPYSLVGSVVAPTVTFTDLSGTGNVLVEGTKYFWVVTATGAGGTESLASTELSGTVPFSPPPPPVAGSVTVR